MISATETESCVGFKITKLGWIPEDWEVVRLDQAINFLDNKRKPIKSSEREKRNGIYPYYGASGIIDYIDDFIFNDELILLGEDGANVIMRSSALAFKASGKFWVNNHAHVLKPKTDYDIDFLTNYLESLKYDKYNTSKAQPKLNKDVCASIPISRPSYEEQVRIGTCLSTWDTAITKLDTLIKAKQQLKKALMQQLLSGKKRLPGFDGEWEELIFSDIANRVMRKNEEADDTVVTISAQRGFVLQEDFFNKRVASSTLLNYTLVHKGEYCYNKSYSKGYPMGAFKRLDDFDKAVVTTLYICFSLKDNVDSDFMNQYFEAGKMIPGLMRIAQEGGRAHGLLNISLPDFFNLPVSVPILEEQTAIAQVLNTADQEIELLTTQCNQLQLQKKGLMQQLLTGKKRLRV